MVARDFFEVLISYEFYSMTVLKVAQKSIGERVKYDYRRSNGSILAILSLELPCTRLLEHIRTTVKRET